MINQPHKIMTPEEYAATKIIGWHSVCKNVDGAGNIGIRFGDGEAPPKFGPLLEIGQDFRFGDMDYRAHSKVKDLSFNEMIQFRAMIPVAIKEIELLWDTSPHHPMNLHQAACQASDPGRPVPPHGSGPDDQ